MTDFSGNADDDRRLLRRFGEKRDEASFRELVERYSGIVYGTAMRKTGRPEWAADITQNVFISLGKKALQLSRAEIPAVGAWLHHAATLESLRHLRDQINSQRRDKMLRKGLDENPMYPPPGIREQVLPQLDEALEKLPAKDRDILILHYFDGLRFGDIASRLGLRADAVQKRSIRALEKLSRLLKTRGELLPVSVLAVLLSSELSKAAPVSLIKTINSAVSAKAVGGKAITIMTLTSKSTIAGASAVLVFLAALLGVGYFTKSGEKTAQANRPPSSPEGRNTPEFSIADEPAGMPETPPTASRPGSVAEAGEESPLVSAMNRLRELGSEREAVMAEARARLQAGASFGEIREFLLRIEAIDKESVQVLVGLGDNFGDALPSIEEMEGGRSKDWLLALFFKHWARIDPRDALAAAGPYGSQAVKGVYRGWGAGDPLQALLHQRSVASQDQSAGREALLRIFDGWVGANPAEAMNGLTALEYDDQKTAFKAFDDALQSESLRPALLDAVDKLEDQALRADLVRDFCTNWGRVASDEATAWFDSLEFENPRLGIPAAMELLKGKLQTGRASEGADWIWPKLPPDLRAGFIADFVEGEWASLNKEEAATWLEIHKNETAPNAR